jgi:hypothetical protein
MNRLLLATMAAVCVASAFAQGTVQFHNYIPGSVITHVYFGGTAQIVGNGSNEYSDSALTPGTVDWSGFGLAAGSQFYAQLLAAPGANQPESALVPASPVVNFRTGAFAGYVNGATATLNGVAPDALVATVEMVAWWDPSGGIHKLGSRAGCLGVCTTSGWYGWDL